MSEEKTESTPAAAASGGSGGGNNKLVMIVTVVNLLITLGIVGALFVSHKKEAQRQQVTDIAAGEEHGGEHGGGGGGEHGGGGEAGGGEGHGGGHGESKPQKKGLAGFGTMITLEQFTVNLSTPGTVNPKFVRVNISVEVPDHDSESEVQQKMPQVRNAIIDLFNSKRPTDLATAEGRDYLKEEIRHALNSFLTAGKVKGVFFTNFSISS